MSQSMFYINLVYVNLSQCFLDDKGASNLVIDLIIKNTSNKVFLETVELGIALLEGGNSKIQVQATILFQLCFSSFRYKIPVFSFSYVLFLFQAPTSLLFSSFR